MTPFFKVFTIIIINILLHTILQQANGLLPVCLQTPPIVPNQIRLALIPNGMVVSWQTFGTVPTGSNPNTQPKVAYGLSQASLNQTSTDGYGSVYDTRDACYTSYFYNVNLRNLSASTTYYYRILQSTYANASNVYSFQTAPVPGDQSRPINITIFGDLGVDIGLSLGDASRTRNALEQMIPLTDMFIHSGDFAYADDTPTYEITYNSWQSDMTSITSVRPYMTCMGGPANIF